MAEPLTEQDCPEHVWNAVTGLIKHVREGLSRSLTFTIPGSLQTETKRNVNAGGFMRRVDTPKAKDFKALASLKAAEAIGDSLPYDEPLLAILTWRKPKPPSGYRKFDEWPFKRPDTKNYLAILEDAIDSIVMIDDARICVHHLRKEWGVREEVVVTLMPLQPDWPYDRREGETP